MLTLYKETAVDPAEGASRSSLPIQVPAHDGSYNRSRFAQPKSNQLPAKDETTFATRFLATQSSIYFRKFKTYPRTFLWRVSDDSKLLEIRCADLAKSGQESHEAAQILKLEFQHGVLPAGVAFADVEDHDMLHAFVITAGKELYTLALHPDFFKRPVANSDNVREWCKSSVPSSFTIAYPHRIHASTPFELFVSLDSGALLRLVRKAGHDGMQAHASVRSSSS